LLKPPPPQNWPLGHEPQSSVPPHPSPFMPHVKPDWAHVLGVQLLLPLSGLTRLPSFGLLLPLSLPVDASCPPG
jgi:hypothetical protein